MALSEYFRITQGTRRLLAVTTSVAVIAVLFAVFYYRGINRSEDPRVTRARQYMADYDRMAGGTNSFSFFDLLDSAAVIYNSVPDYKNSFERGVIYNNKCSGLLMMALYDASLNDSVRKSLIELSVAYCDSSMSVYQDWKNEWGGLPEESVRDKLSRLMNADDAGFQGHNFSRVFRKRVDDILLAQVEIDRRLSVSLTNRGTAYRHLEMQDSALFYYQEALALWNHNRTAKSNLSVLMGGDPVKPGLIESLFPPDRKKSQATQAKPE